MTATSRLSNVVRGSRLGPRRQRQDGGSMSDSTGQGGWYPDPANGSQLRYWDGTAWTEHVHDPNIASPSAGGEANAPSEGDQSMPWWQRWFAIVPLLLLCAPVGLFGLWKRPGTGVKVKAGFTVATVLLVAVVALADEPAEDPLATATPTPTATATRESTTVPVPVLVGRSTSEAASILDDEGLEVGEITEVESDEAPGTVLEQSTESGTEADPGDEISLVVAAPHPKVPNVVGKSKSEAVKALRAAGYKVKVNTKTVRDGADNVVLKQTPQARSRLATGSVITIVVSDLKKPPVSGGNCTPGYSPCLAPAEDYDCAGGGGNGPEYVYGTVYVTGSDPYDLDSDGDGVACGE
jgi:hypothetical protein